MSADKNLNLNHNNLNNSQRQAVEHGSGALLVYAGAGSGKTRVLTHRITRLIKDGEATPDRIFAVTFTNKAAKEMKERINSLLGATKAPEYVSTFHSACARILRRHAPLLNFTRDFTIYDRSEALSVMKKVYKKLKVDPKEIEPRALLNKIDRAKNNYLFSDHFRKIGDNESYMLDEANVMADLYDGYQQELQACNAMDFGDLICHVVTLFKLEPKVLNYYKARFTHILVDEYQDTNRIQYILISMLAKEHGNICVVGDDDQSVYSFRGANTENINSFKRDFPDHTTIVLDINYRSTASILAAANAVIENNQSRHKKSLKTKNPAGNQVMLFSANDELDEAGFVSRKIKQLQREGISLSEIAIFYRTNAQSRALEETFYAENIPHIIYGGQRFYDRKEVKDILGYCKLAINTSDNEAFNRTINSPTRGIGKTSVEKMRALAESNEQSLFKTVSAGVTGLSAKAKKSLEDFVSLITEIQSKSIRKEQATTEQSVQLDLRELLQMIVEKTAYFKSLEKLDSEEAQSRIENILELFSVAEDFTRRCKEEGKEATLSDFLERTALNSGLDESEFGESVSLMTLHLAKGLEYDAVFLVGLEEGLLPHSRSLDEKSALEEERRLCYVGITRARKELFLSHAHTRSGFGMGYWGGGGISRFLLEIPEELVEMNGASF